MPTYEIQPCANCGAVETICRMANMKKDDQGRVYRPCVCGQWSMQAYRTAPNGYVDAPADSKPFQVAGIEGTFRSHKQLEAHCKANNLDLSHTNDDSWKKVKYRAKRGAEALATEQGYSSLGAYKEALKDNAHISQSVNEAKERTGVARG